VVFSPENEIVMAEDDDKKDTSLASDKSLGSCLDEIGWQLGERRILLKLRPLRPDLRRQSVPPPRGEQE
jgi:hypothetical protein